MAKNFDIAVWWGDRPGPVPNVVVKTMLEATSIACSNLSKDRRVSIQRVDWPITHRTSAAAQAYIDVQLFQLEG